MSEIKLEKATFGAGCFWCIEAIYNELVGVVEVEPGYMGGKRENPTYKQVCSGATGHAEVAQITYDANKISFQNLLEVFWKIHDPTTLNRQGADVGTQYRSVIFYHNKEQQKLALQLKEKLDASGVFSDKVVTEISPAETFWIAEQYHFNYFKQNGEQGYCRIVIQPKIEKFRKIFAEKIK